MNLYIPWNVRPVDFWGYTSGVSDRLFESDYRTGDQISELKHNLLARCQELGIPAWDDNKIVFECATDCGKRFFIGFYDGRMSIGFDMWSESHNYESKRRAWGAVQIAGTIPRDR